MKNKENKKENKEHDKLPGYPSYPEGEDIYSKDKETNIDPEKLAEQPVNTIAEEPEMVKGKGTNDSLDIPGAELDDEAENSGAEDEENNYYSLGGDSKSSLDEDDSTKQ